MIPKARKISDLNDLTTFDNDNLFVLVDVNDNETKKITFGNLFSMFFTDENDSAFPVYNEPFTKNRHVQSEGNMFLKGGSTGGVATGAVIVDKFLNVVDSIVDNNYTQAFIVGNLDYIPSGAGDFVGQAGDTVNVIIDGILYEDIDLSAVTTLAGLYIPINARTGAYNAFTSLAQLRIESITTTINSYVEIQEGTNTAQPVLARIGFGAGIDKICMYGVGKKSIDVNNRVLYNTSGGTPLDWSAPDVLRLTPDGTKSEWFGLFGVGMYYDMRFILYQNDTENEDYSNIAIGQNSDVGFPMLTSFKTDKPVIGIAPNVPNYNVGTCLAIEDLGFDEFSNPLGMRIYGYYNGSQTKAQLELILQSPDGTSYILKVDDNGSLFADTLY